jgi:CTP:molybdopterin cytidylyltransferase MocA
MKNVAAILLAAGQSRRMGAFKPLLPFGSQTVIESCLSSMIEGGIKPTSVVVVVGHRAQDIRNHLKNSPVRFALNPDPTSEMNASIAAGISLLPAHYRAVVIGLVDYPAIPSTVVSSLIAEWLKGEKLVKPTHQGRGGHPVLVDLALRNELLNLDQENGLKGLFVKNLSNVRRIEVDSPYIARDIDTWDDYARLHREVFGQAAPEPVENPSNETPSRLI